MGLSITLGVSLFLAAITVKQSDTPLRSTGCEVDDEAIATLDAKTPVEVKFSVAGGSEACYKVAVTVDGKPRTGYLPASALADLAEFDRIRQEAASLDPSQVKVTETAETIRKALSGSSQNNATVQQASELIKANQPGAALTLLDPLVKQRSTNADVYMLAGFAAWRNDQPRDALDFWKTALEIRPDPNLQALYARVEREVTADKSGERLVGLRVLLRFDRDAVPAPVARQMLEILDAEVSKDATLIGCPTSERLVAIVQSRDAYFQTTQAAEWSGGQYNGRIRVPYDPVRTPASMQRVFAHEVVHACLANLGTWPPWLHEGLAQKLSGDTLSPQMQEKIKELAARHALPKLDDFRRDWSGLNTDNALVAYGVALAAADLLFENYSNTGLVNILRNPSLFARVTADLNHRLGLE
ncbi:MAG TPA: tetratricopeptide repeat protein [Bryobacteraceae bacterium]|jgi:hypothetical protein